MGNSDFTTGSTTDQLDVLGSLRVSGRGSRDWRDVSGVGAWLGGILSVGGIYIVACQVHPALVKEVQCWYHLFNFNSLLARIHVVKSGGLMETPPLWYATT